MQRTFQCDEFIYYSKTPSVIEYMKLILAHLKMDYRMGVSSDGSTIFLSKSDNARFEAEAKQWQEAAERVSLAFIVTR